MTTKICTKCGETKTTDQFYKDRTRRDGLQHRCKKCSAAHQRAYNEANRDKIATRHRTYRETHREEIAARKRAYWEANRKQGNARSRARYSLVGEPHTHRAQSITKKHATRKYDRWTPEEDHYLLTGPGTYLDKALQLSRTRSAVAVRAATLRRQEQTA